MIGRRARPAVGRSRSNWWSCPASMTALVVYLVVLLFAGGVDVRGQAPPPPWEDASSPASLAKARTIRVGFLFTLDGIPAALQYRAIFEDYLTATVGSQFNPPRTFQMVILNVLSPVLLDGTLDAWAAVSTGEVDFVFSNAAVWTCLEAGYATTLLASVILYDESLSLPLEVEGGYLLTTAGRTDLNTIADLTNQSIVISSPLASLLGVQSQWYELTLLNYTEAYLWDLPAYILINIEGLPTMERLFLPASDVSNRVDLLFTSPTKVANPLTNPKGRAIGVDLKLVGARTYSASGNPRAVSTAMYPQAAFGALASTSSSLSRLVAAALFNLSSTDPRAVAANVAGFRTPKSYVSTENVITALQLADPATQTCQKTTLYNGTVDIYPILSCPAGKLLLSREVVAAGCAKKGYTCPDSFACVCSPCMSVPLSEFTITARITASNNATRLALPPVRCLGISQCIDFNQHETVQVTFTDNYGPALRSLLARPITRIRYKYASQINELSNDILLPYTTWPNNYTDAANNLWASNVPTSSVGYRMLLVEINGVDCVDCPTFFAVTTPTCEPLQTPAADGTCSCAAGYFLSPSGCLTTLLLTSYDVAYGICGTAVLAAGAWLLFYALRRRSDDTWRISHDDLVFSAKEEIIGQGAYGLVTKAVYRGTVVAVKRGKSLESGARESVIRAARVSGTGSAESAPPPPPPLSRLASARAANAVAPVPVDALGAIGAVPGRRGSRTRAGLAAPRLSGSGSGSGLVGLSGGATGTGSGHGSGSGSAGGRGGEKTHVLPALVQLLARSGGGIGTLASGDAPPAKHHHGAAQKVGGSGTGGVLRSKGSAERLSNAAGDTGTAGGSTAGGRGTGRSTFGWFGRAVVGICGGGGVKRLEEQFIEEISNVVHLRHPKIVTVLGGVLVNKQPPLLLMEYLELGALSDLLQNVTAPLTPDVLVGMIQDVCSGMQYLHLNKPAILHKDLKAANVLVDRSFQAKVCDFGLSFKSEGRVMGTPLFMAPELLRGQDASPASDVYAFGIMLYEMWARATPYADSDEPALDILSKIADPDIGSHPLWCLRPVMPPSVPPYWSGLMRRCTDAKADNRPTFTAIADEIRAANRFVINAAVPLAGGISGRPRSRSHDPWQRLTHEDIRLPPAVEAIVRSGGTYASRSLPHLSLVHIELGNLSSLQSAFELAPECLVDLLYRLYKLLDALAAAHGLFPVATVVESYLAVGGLLDGDPVGAPALMARAAAFASEAAEASAVFQADGAEFAFPPLDNRDLLLGGTDGVSLRIVGHVGPASVGVVQKSTADQRLCVSGATMTELAELRAAAAAGQILLSSAAVEALESLGLAEMGASASASVPESAESVTATAAAPKVDYAFGPPPPLLGPVARRGLPEGCQLLVSPGAAAVSLPPGLGRVESIVPMAGAPPLPPPPPPASLPRSSAVVDNAGLATLTEEGEETETETETGSPHGPGTHHWRYRLSGTVGFRSQSRSAFAPLPAVGGPLARTATAAVSQTLRNVKKTWEALGPEFERVGLEGLRLLFEAIPDALIKFVPGGMKTPGYMETHKIKAHARLIIRTIGSVITAFDDGTSRLHVMGHLRSSLVSLGRTHRSLGVSPSQVQVACVCFSAAFKSVLGQGWTQEMSVALSWALEIVSTAMAEGISDRYSEEGGGITPSPAAPDLRPMRRRRSVTALHPEPARGGNDSGTDGAVPAGGSPSSGVAVEVGPGLTSSEEQDMDSAPMVVMDEPPVI